MDTKKEEMTKMCSLEQNLKLQSFNSENDIKFKTLNEIKIKTLNEIENYNNGNHKLGEREILNEKAEIIIQKNMELFFKYEEEKKTLLKSFFLKWKSINKTHKNKKYHDNFQQRKLLYKYFFDINEENLKSNSFKNDNLYRDNSKNNFEKKDFYYTKIDPSNFKIFSHKNKFFLKSDGKQKLNLVFRSY